MLGERPRIALRSNRAARPRLCRPLSIRLAKNIPLYRNSDLSYVSAHPGSSRRGDLEVVLIASRACGGRGSVGMRGAGRAGSPCELAAACRRTALLGFVSPVSFQLRRQGWKYCGERTGRAYGKTVWSWPSLLRSSRIEDAREPNRVDGIIQFERRGRPKESSAPGRARHKPSDHRAGKAE